MLEIREAQFEELDIRRVPARLIRRDLQTQLVVRREKVLDGGWKQVDLSGTYWSAYIDGMLADGDPDVVLVAPKNHARYRKLLDGLWKLRDAGIAEPD